MKYYMNGKLENYEVIYINKISSTKEENIKKIYRVRQGDRYRNIIEEDNTIYEVDND